MSIFFRAPLLALAVLALTVSTADLALAQTTVETTVQASERGTAVRYDPGATGIPTASGEPYNPERLTLAHPTLPFGTLVELTNLANGQVITARVNDRAPAAGALRVQVSARVADHLGLAARPGDITLKLGADEVALLEERAAREKTRRRSAEAAEATPVAQAASSGRFTVQLASFSDEGRAIARADEIRGAWVQPVAVNGATVYRVCYGVFNSPSRAASGREFLQTRGVDGFVKSLDAPVVRTDETPVRPTSIDN